MAVPNDPVHVGSLARILRPAAVVSEGDGVMVAPNVCITLRRNGFCSYEHFTMYTSRLSPKCAAASESAVPHWPAPVSVVMFVMPSAYA